MTCRWSWGSSPQSDQKMSVLNCVQRLAQGETAPGYPVLLSELTGLECWQSGLQMTRGTGCSDSLGGAGVLSEAGSVRKFEFIGNIFLNSLPTSFLHSVSFFHRPVWMLSWKSTAEPPKLFLLVWGFSFSFLSVIDHVQGNNQKQEQSLCKC